MTSLVERGASCLSASSVMPTMTLPCHTSLFLSVPPERHGIVENLWRTPAVSHPGLFEVVRHASLRASMHYNWAPLRHMAAPESLYFSWFLDCLSREDGDDRVAEAAAVHIERDEPDFAFVYLGTADIAGHDHRFLGDRYLRQVERIDGCVGRLLAAHTNVGHVLLLSDHGGHEWTHGTDEPEDMTIPWVLAGPGVRSGETIDAPVSLLDTAPTIAHLLGLPAPDEWEGRVVHEALLSEGLFACLVPEAGAVG
jgi:predicted AlkP superfamily pyrophosphatase or phosphodiesterase